MLAVIRTQMCKFLSEEVREKRAFFVAPPLAFPLSLLRSRNSGLLRIIHTLVLKEEDIKNAL